MTHGVKIEVVGDTTLAGVAQTSSGTILILENQLGAYAVYTEVKTKMPHVHIPIKYLKIEDDKITLNVTIMNDERGVKEVLRDLLICLRMAECYIDTEVKGKEIVWKELRSIMSLRMLSFVPFGAGTHQSPLNNGERYDLDDDYEIIGWVWLTDYGELKANGVNVKLSDDKKGFFYNNRKFPPGVYYLIRKNGREYLISERTLKSL